MYVCMHMCIIHVNMFMSLPSLEFEFILSPFAAFKSILPKMHGSISLKHSLPKSVF